VARRVLPVALVIALSCAASGASLASPRSASRPWPVLAQASAETAEDPGVPASPEVVYAIQLAAYEATRRFNGMDMAGLLTYVSEDYRTGPFTKPVVRKQLGAIFGLYDEVHATVRVDTVRMVGDHAWIFSTGEVVGRLRLVRAWTYIIKWQRELEVARQEAGAWRLYGYQQ
jgi:hypothetical protein